MSRIEKALEMAEKMRSGAAVSASVRRQESATIPPVAAPFRKSPGSTNYMPPKSEMLIHPDSHFLVNLFDPYSPIAEEFRKLKAELVNLTKGEDFFKNSLMITSSSPEEGKTLTALNLAITLAQEYDHTVLLIDANFRRPSIHEYLKIDNIKGFSNCLAGETEIAEVLIPTGIGRLSVITAGGEVSNPAELFASQKTGAIIAEMKHRYNDRYIIFDAPAVLPFAEARTLAHLVDGTIFVVKEHQISQKKIREALDALRGCEILGTVYNDITYGADSENYFSYR